ncbi:MAG: MFS transporter [Candidatus Rokuibacteriota bacterium]
MRWLIMAVPAAIYFVSYFHRVAPAVVAADLMRAFAVTAAAVGTLASIYPYVFAVMALVAGSLVDTLGPRRTLALGGATMGAGAVVFGLAPVFSVAMAGRLAVGLGASVVLIAFLALAAEWFRPDEFATVSGLSQTVGNLGGLVAASPLAVLVEAIGWRQSFVAIGAVTGLLGLLALFAVRDRPETLGLPRVAPGGSRALGLRGVLRGIPAVVSNPRTWPPIVAAGGVYATLISFLGLWGVPYLVQVYGLSRLRAATLVSAIAVGVVAGSPLTGWISDRRLGARRLPFVVSATLYAACWLPLVIPAWRPPVELLAPFFFLMGLTSCGLVLVWSCVREVNDPARVGIVVGFCNVPIFLLFAVLQWLTGVILDAGWTGSVVDGMRLYPVSAWTAAFGTCLAIAVVAVGAATRITETYCRNIWQSRAQSSLSSIAT